MASLPLLGVGVVYCSGIEPLFELADPPLDVIEVEPQTLWHCEPSERPSLRIDEAALDHLAQLKCPKLIHSVGFPVGGLRSPDAIQIPLMRHMISALAVPWVSEHLSFNQAFGPTGKFFTGFLLPPRQTATGVAAAVASVRTLSSALPVPLAVETGVNYLRPRHDELADGDFAAAVAEQADCGILLDLHNLWTNERNGRQSAMDFLRRLPLERVWEMHLAGGAEFRGYWIDEHGGGIPPPVLDLASRLMPSLPNLRAVIFEITPSHLERVGIGLVRSQLESVRRAWESRGQRSRSKPRRSQHRCSVATPPPAGDPISPETWEDTLGGLVIGRDVPSPITEDLLRDPGVALIRTLVQDFRASVVVDLLKLTSRLIMLHEGWERFRALLESFWAKAPPELFASVEAGSFARYLRDLALPVPHLDDVMSFELSVIATLADRQRRVVRFGCDPIPLLEGLASRRIVTTDEVGTWEVEIVPDSVAAYDAPERHILCPH